MLDTMLVQSEANARSQEELCPVCRNNAAPEARPNVHAQEKRHESPALLTIRTADAPAHQKKGPGGMLDTMLVQSEANARSQEKLYPVCRDNAAPEARPDACTQKGPGLCRTPFL